MEKIKIIIDDLSNIDIKYFKDSYNIDIDVKILPFKYTINDEVFTEFTDDFDYENTKVEINLDDWKNAIDDCDDYLYIPTNDFLNQRETFKSISNIDILDNNVNEIELFNLMQIYCSTYSEMSFKNFIYSKYFTTLIIVNNTSKVINSSSNGYSLISYSNGNFEIIDSYDSILKASRVMINYFRETFTAIKAVFAGNNSNIEQLNIVKRKMNDFNEFQESIKNNIFFNDDYIGISYIEE